LYIVSPLSEKIASLGMEPQGPASRRDYRRI
jgi:hypothetical protein